MLTSLAYMNFKMTALAAGMVNPWEWWSQKYASPTPNQIYDKKIYCKYYSQGIVVFLVSNVHVDSELLTDYFSV